ncbi:LysR family transcriptional regulator [Shimia sp. R9_1]|uniref:LysR family transcriptional regulator n=1 Tax=Shimia sp. R9_1 TaxID=2821111 RepID=UPI001ADC5B05|nr:LysR family transcriptional regulator [Shimia sp. R9_1]MBO9409639.1 LysR family transcriptional regulator [Shimia sp. R9_1]
MPYLLSVCEAGSLAGAARMLRVNHSTVFRRIEAVEARLGVRLFERLARGYIMTPAGERFYERAILLCEGMDELERELGGQDLRLEGPLTVTTTDSLLHCLAPIFAQFRHTYPDVELRLLSDVQALDLMQRDADIALRPTNNPPEHWIGRDLFSLSFATYAHRDYWQAVQDDGPEYYHWIMLGDDLNQSPMSKITLRRKHQEAKSTVLNTMMSVFDMVNAGFGIAAMPCYLGEKHETLVRVDEPDDSAGWRLWLLAHPDVRRSARVNAFYDFATKHITDEVLGIS